MRIYKFNNILADVYAAIAEHAGENVIVCIDGVSLFMSCDSQGMIEWDVIDADGENIHCGSCGSVALVKSFALEHAHEYFPDEH